MGHMKYMLVGDVEGPYERPHPPTPTYTPGLSEIKFFYRLLSSFTWNMLQEASKSWAT